MPEAQTAFANARENHVAGRLDEAERLYRVVLAIIPQHADSRRLLEVITYQTGQHETAIRMIGEAIAIDPNVAPYHYNLGVALYGKGLVDEAIASLRCRRSITPDRLACLFGVAGLHFFSLQIGGPAMPKELRVTDVMDEMDDFADTAALIANLDLIISVDTAIAHLGAALGKPVWVLDRFDPCWRWLVGRRDSPWYPTLHVYRQPRPGDWEPVLAEVTRDLRSFAHSSGSNPTPGAVV
jgi:tetratricopeptide (TPR) repeat protein